METPEPVIVHEVPHKNMMELLINDPDFRKERAEEDRYEDDYMTSEERAKEEYLEEVAKNHKKPRSRKGDAEADELEETPVSVKAESPQKQDLPSKNASAKAAKKDPVPEAEISAKKSAPKAAAKTGLESASRGKAKPVKVENSAKVESSEKIAKTEKTEKTEKAEKMAKSVKEKTSKVSKKSGK